MSLRPLNSIVGIFSHPLETKQSTKETPLTSSPHQDNQVQLFPFSDPQEIRKIVNKITTFFISKITLYPFLLQVRSYLEYLNFEPYQCFSLILLHFLEYW